MLCIPRRRLVSSALFCLTSYYRSDHARETATKLEQAYRQRDTMLGSGVDTTALDQRILDLKRDHRKGFQLQPGEFLGEGRYQLIDMLGRGGFATVWLANDRRANRSVAIKVLHGQFSASEERRERLFLPFAPSEP